MSMFGTYAIANSGIDENRAWLDAIGDNIANINTVEPMSGPAFQARYVVAQAVPSTNPTPMAGQSSGLDSAESQIGQGVEVSGVALGSATGQVTYDPGSPLANTAGLVRDPDISLADQMTSLIVAQNGYEANLAVVTRATAAYQSALELTT
jgi:flagellar basal-body rod protein FlgC